MGAETRMGQRWASPALDQHCLAMHTSSPLCKPKPHAQDLEDKPGATDNIFVHLLNEATWDNSPFSAFHCCV